MSNASSFVSNEKMAFAYVDTSGNYLERMRITSAGDVGIGIEDTQGFRLAVNGTNLAQGDTTTTMRIFDNASATTGTGGGISFGGYYSGTSLLINTFSYIKGGKENSTAGNYASYLSFGTRVDGGGATERMRITSGGNVGIGTTTPNFTEANRKTLDINGPSSSGIGLSAAGTLYGYIYANSGTALMGTKGTIALELQTNETTRVIVDGTTGAATFSSSVTATTGIFNGFSINATPTSSGTSQTFVQFLTWQ